MFAALACVLLCAIAAESQEPRLETPIAIKNATVVTQAGQSIEGATVVIDNGRIVAVGPDVTIAPGTRELDGSGLIVYPGFIDALTRAGVEEIKTSETIERRYEDEFPSIPAGPRPAMAAANRAGILARRRIEDILDVKADTWDDARKAGFTAALAAGPRAIIGGTASVIQLGDRPVRRSILAADIAHSASLDRPERRAMNVRGSYPSATFGVIAHFRQTMNDARWYRDMKAYVAKHPEARGDLPLDPDLEALQPVLAGRTPVIWEANSEDEIHRVLNLADEFGLKTMIVGGREAYKVLERLKAGKVPLLITLKLPEEIKEYKFEANKIRKRDDDESIYGKKWQKRPFVPEQAYDDAKRLRDETVANIIKLEEAGVAWCLSGYELKSPKDALKNVREIVEAGLSADAALRGLTANAAEILGVDSQIGTIAPGKRANLTVMTKPFTEKKSKVRWVFVDGRQFEFDTSKSDDKKKGGKPDDDPDEADLESTEIDEADQDESESDEDEDEQADEDEDAEEVAPGPLDDILLHEPAWQTESDVERDPGIKTGGSVLLSNATVLTISGEDLPNTSVLIENGRITAIGRDLTAPDGVRTFDLTGQVIMPGIIDPHSHMATSATNEFSLSVVPEVRCEDVVRHDDVGIYRALTGGTTTIHTMHGSANPIGGQNVSLKLKYGRPSSELIIRDRTRTVKFALGENVKRSGMQPRRFGGNSDRGPRRFPGTRMGVEATMRRAFTAARRYAEDREEYRQAVAAGRDVPPLRSDLRLEALTDIMNGDIWVHCHCYRADEILRLLSVAEDFGFRIAVLQHVLEGYRVMPEIARHGCGTSTFADWWAYKIEAYNAVPQNAGMMLKYGINATINSDSGDLVRHLNFEAAKCMKYSGLTSNEALRLITLNCARQLGLQDRIGSIEVGKDGDIAVFDGHPLDTFSKCVLTLVEGEVYFRHRDFDPFATKAPGRPLKNFRVANTNGDGARTGLEHLTTVSMPAADAGRAGTNGSNGNNADLVITNANIHPVSSDVIENGTILIRDGKIAAVGSGIRVPAGVRVIDAGGRHVWPGLINAGTQVGLSEIGQVAVTVDTSPTGDFQPDLMAVSALNPHSAMVEVTRAEGLTTALIVPGGPVLGGQAGLVNTDGWTMNEMLIDAKAALMLSFPSAPADPIAQRPSQRRGGRRGSEISERFAKSLKGLENFLRDAKLYADATVAARKNNTRPPLAPDPRYDALIPYVLGQKPVLFNAGGYKAILEVLMFAERTGLKPIIFGGSEAWKLADVLAKRNVPVIYDGVFSVPRGENTWDASYSAMAVMAEAGVKFCLMHRSASLAKNMAMEAGFGVAHGLNPDDAIRAMTLSAAEILGVDDKLGSIEVGKIANLIITTDHPCQATNVVTDVIIAGKPTTLQSQHTRHASRFAGRPTPSLPPASNTLNGPPSQTNASRTNELRTKGSK